MDQITPNPAFAPDHSVCEHKKVKYFEFCLCDLGYEDISVSINRTDDDEYSLGIAGR